MLLELLLEEVIKGITFKMLLKVIGRIVNYKSPALKPGFFYLFSLERMESIKNHPVQGFSFFLWTPSLGASFPAGSIFLSSAFFINLLHLLYPKGYI